MISRKIIFIVFTISVFCWEMRPLMAAPQLKFGEIDKGFGFMTQGQKTEHTYSFANAGDEPLVIMDLKASCGCTKPSTDKKQYAPGESGRLKLVFDSRGKFGIIKKRIYVFTNDPLNPMQELTIQGEVSKSAHPEMTGTKNLFEGECRTCHVDRGEGKTGEELYMADCAMCHENHLLPGGHFVAPAACEMAGLSEKHLYKATADGVKNKSMPAYLKDQGGPLIKEQIDTLVEFMKESVPK